MSEFHVRNTDPISSHAHADEIIDLLNGPAIKKTLLEEALEPLPILRNRSLIESHGEKVVGIVKFEDKLIVATENGVYKLEDDILVRMEIQDGKEQENM